MTFRRRWAALMVVGTAEFHVLPLGIGTWGLVTSLSDVTEWSPVMLVVGLFWGAIAAFGAFASWWFSREPRALKVSARDIRLRPFVGRDRRVDVASVARIVTYERDGSVRVAFLPHAGPAFWCLDAKDWPKGMAATIGERAGVAVDDAANLDLAMLRARYPENAEGTAGHLEAHDDWGGRPWPW